MLNFPRRFDKSFYRHVEKQIIYYSTSPDTKKEVPHEEFRILNLRQAKGQIQKRPPRKIQVIPPRTDQMAIDQDWGSVWPGPRSFHPATVPLPVRQGYVEKGAPPGKFANAELMKIPNFLHLTPPVIKRQCEALKKFCTPWPNQLDSDEKCSKHFPVEVISSDYCYSSSSIRDPLARIVTIRFKLSSLNLDKRATDKFRRLVGDKYNEENDIVTIVADRCPLKKQNYDYAMYLLTACYHESMNKEPWEDLKSEADMEYYDWNLNASKTNVEAMFGKPAEEITNIKEYVDSVVKLINDGESDYTLQKYGEAVQKLLGLTSSST